MYYFNERDIPRVQNDPSLGGCFEGRALEFCKTAMKALTV